jgi:hypothetical protein
MSKGLPRSTGRGAPQAQEIIKQVIRVNALAIEVDGASGVGFGSAVAGGLPAGNILLLGAVSYLAFSGPTSAGLVDTWAGDYGVGTTPASDATISGADIDIIGSTEIAAATAEVSPRTRGVGVTATNAAILDNTDGSLEVNINLLVDDANISADDIAMTVTGEIHLAYIVLGDD